MTDDIKKLIQQNFVTNNMFAAGYNYAIQTELCADYLRTDCGMPSDTFNVSIPLRDCPNPNLYDEMVNYFIVKRYTMSLWLWDFLTRWQKWLAAAELSQTEVNLGMYADIDNCLIVPEKPAGFAVKLVQSADDVRLFAQVMASVFGKCQEAENVKTYYQALADTAFYQDDCARYFVGFAKGRPISSGAIVKNDDSVGIYDIATLEECRGHGYGSAMFHHILAYIKANCRRLCVLQASPEGAGIYRRAGFTPACDIFVYENAGLLMP